jgi:hypothetical protein
MLSVSDIEELKKRYEDRKSRIAKVDAVKNMKLKDIKEKLSVYGITDIKEFPKLLKKKEADSLEVGKLAEELNTYLETSESELQDLENEING